MRRRIEPLADRVLRGLQRLAASRRLGSPAARRITLLVAVIVLAGATVTTWRQLDAGLDVRRPLMLLPAAALAIAAVLFNSLEYVLIGRVAGVNVALRDALRIAVLSATANLLPIPGAAAVKFTALLRSGVPRMRAGVATLAVAVVWAGTGIAFGGLAWLHAGARAAGVAALAVGVVGVAGGLAVASYRRPAGTRPFVTSLLLLEVAAVGLGALRLSLVVSSLGSGLSPAHGAAMYAAAAIAAAVGVFPAGLGLREWLSIGSSTLVGLPAGIGFYASILDRLVSLPMLVVAAIGLLTGRMGPYPGALEEPDAEGARR